MMVLNCFWKWLKSKVRKKKVKVYIQASWLNNSQFTLKYLLKDLHVAFSTIDIERIQDLAKSIGPFNIEYLDNQSWICRASPGFNFVQISRGLVEIVWCICYSHILLYSEIAEQKKFSKKNQYFTYSSNQRTKTAIDLLKICLSNWFNKSTSKIDINSIIGMTPSKNSGDIYIRNANEMARMVISFYLYHEFAHLKLHKGKPPSIVHEKEADEFAVAWFLDQDFKSNYSKEVKFSHAVALSFLILAIRCIHLSDCDGFTHPHSIDRLVDNLTNYISYPDHPVWSIMSFSIKVHLDAVNIQIPIKVYSTHKECFDEYMQILKFNFP